MKLVVDKVIISDIIIRMYKYGLDEIRSTRNPLIDKIGRTQRYEFECIHCTGDCGKPSSGKIPEIITSFCNRMTIDVY